MGAKLGQNNIKGEQTKIAILAAAERVFAESGYRGSSLASIAERSGVTQSGLLHHFKTKEELLQAVLEQHEARDDDMLRGPLSGGGLAVVDGLAETVGDGPDRIATRLFAVLAAECTAVDHPGHDYMREHYARLRNRLIGALSVGGPWYVGERPIASEALASALIATMDGIRLQWIYDSTVDMGAAFDVVSGLLRNSVRSASPA